MGRELPKTLTREEARALLAAPNVGCPTGLRDRAILELMYRNGLRVGEACGLHLRDVDLAEGTIHVRPEIAKGGFEAWLPLDREAERWVAEWKRRRREFAAGKPHLFTTLKGGPVDRRQVWRMMQRRAARAGLNRRVWPHMLRHTYASELLADGFTIAEVQRLLRHQDLRSTTIYLHVRDEDLQRKIRGRNR